MKETAAPYTPVVIEHESAGYAEFVMKDTATVTHPGREYDILTSVATGEAVGFRWQIRHKPSRSTGSFTAGSDNG